jgi:hypothetical protein
MPELNENPQQIAWDGIAFRLPRAWQPTVVRKSYLFFEQDGRPAFAAKWNRVRGRFSPGRMLQRLQKSLRDSVDVQEWNPEELPALLPAGFTATGFRYRNAAESCLGVILYCTGCRRATMLQLFDADSGGSMVFHRILRSFADHPGGKDQTWSIYDIRARMPAGAELSAHEFLAGRYCLTFSLDSKTLELYRLKPAAAILKKQGLPELGASMAGKAQCVQSDDTGAVWEFRASPLRRLVSLPGRTPGWIWLQLRFIEDKNAILAVKASGRGNMDRELLARIAADFTVGDNEEMPRTET